MSVVEILRYLIQYTWPEIIEIISCSTQLSMKFILLINVKIESKEVSCSTQLGMNFILLIKYQNANIEFIQLINVKIPTIIGISIFIGRLSLIRS